MNNKKIYFGKEAREYLSEGLDIVANAVKVTLGYGGRTVVISETGMPSRTTKDGVTVAKSIKLRDEKLDAGAKFIKDVSAKTAKDVGDGTTTVTVLMQKIVELGIRAINEGANPVFLKKGMDLAAAAISTELKNQTAEVTDELLLGVSTVSANNDKEIGQIISDAYKQLGKHAIITVDESKSEKTYIELTKGFHFISGFTTHHFINNFAKNTCELEKPYVLMAHGRINDPNEIWELLIKVAEKKRSILIIAEDFDISVTQNLLKNSDAMKSCLVRYNFLGDTKEELIHDLCAITGATLMEKKGDNITKIGLEYLGECERAVIAQEETLLIKGNSAKGLLEARIEDARIKISESKHELLRLKQEVRFAKLSGCLAVCYVGGATEVEVMEKQDRIDDSIKATKAAMEEGVLPGGGTSLIKCIPCLNNIQCPNPEMREGILIVAQALEMPARQIISNSGVEDVDTLISTIKKEKPYVGFDAGAGVVKNLLASNIVDPLKVVRLCVENSISAAGQLLTSETLIVSDNE